MFSQREIIFEEFVMYVKRDKRHKKKLVSLLLYNSK